MGYLGGYRGDYLGGYRGDPGLFGSLGKIFKGAVRIGTGVAGSLLPGPAGFIPRSVSRALSPPVRRPPARSSVGTVHAGGPPGMGIAMPRGPIPAPIGTAPGNLSFLTGRRRRRMNPANPKALRRAIRRQDGFVKLARRALKGSGYTIVSRGSRARRTVNVRESGSGSVVVR